jgi:hypothetical protein
MPEENTDGTSRGSGGVGWVAVNWFRDGRIRRAVGYLNRRDALKAVGLAE